MFGDEFVKNVRSEIIIDVLSESSPNILVPIAMTKAGTHYFTRTTGLFCHMREINTEEPGPLLASWGTEARCCL